MIQLSAEMLSETHTEVCFTNLPGFSQSNQVTIKINHSQDLDWDKRAAPSEKGLGMKIGVTRSRF
jgi:hypothetical protein